MPDDSVVKAPPQNQTQPIADIKPSAPLPQEGQEPPVVAETAPPVSEGPPKEQAAQAAEVKASTEDDAPKKAKGPGKPIGVILFAIFVCIALCGLAVYAQISR
jgi:hypothetical protein